MHLRAIAKQRPAPASSLVDTVDLVGGAVALLETLIDIISTIQQIVGKE